MKFCVVTSCDEKYSVISKLTHPNILQYCNKFGIDFYKNSVDYVQGNVGWVWNRGQAIKTVLSQYDWVIWMDSDCLFMDFNVDIRTFIDDKYSLVIGENNNPPCWWKEPTHIECGVFLLRNDDVGHRLIDRSFSTDRILWDKQHKHPWHEQYSMIRTIKGDMEMQSKVKLINMDLINYHQYKIDNGEINDNIFIYHCAGGERYTIEKRMQLLSDKLNAVKVS